LLTVVPTGSASRALFLADAEFVAQAAAASKDAHGVMSYIDAILGRQPVGKRVALIGAGGITPMLGTRAKKPGAWPGSSWFSARSIRLGR
jgi:hypothetical protein